MKTVLIVVVIVCSSIVTRGGLTARAAAASETAAQPSDVTIQGLVRDIACPIQNHEATSTHFNMKCLKECARKGSPLVILTDNGDLYFPISDKMPDTEQRNRLTPFLGKYVQVTGKVYERNGTHAITISKINERKDVHLTIEDQ